MDIYGLLNIDQKALETFPQLGKQVSNLYLDRVINNHINCLNRLAELTMADGPKFIPRPKVYAIIGKALKLAREDVDRTARWNARELSTVCYYIRRLRKHPEVLDYVLEVLDKNWRNLFINGIVFSLLSAWNDLEPTFRGQICRFLRNKLKQYDGRSRRYLPLKNHADWFEESGPMRMAALLVSKGQDLTEAPALLGYKSTTIGLSYFSDVIIQYIKRKCIEDTAYIESILQLHTLDRTKKLLVVTMVEKAEKEGDAVKQAVLCAFINRTLGKVDYIETWAPFPGATTDEVQRLRRAMKLVKTWLTRKVIEVFFEECIQDTTRKDFWLRYISHVSRFKIVGSSLTFHRLMQNSRIADVIQSYFIRTSERPKAQTSALVLLIKDKMIVEFSDLGALYVYNQDDDVCKRVFVNPHISIIDDLKRPIIGSLVEVSQWGVYYYNAVGRMVHRGDWQNRLTWWMNRTLR